MTELDTLKALSWIGVGLGVFAFWYSVRSILEANGTRPILMVLGLTAMWVIIFAIIITDLTYGLTQINPTGLRYYEVFFVRVFSWPVSIAIIWLRWKNDRMHHPLHPGSATMSIPITLSQEDIDKGEIS